LTSSQTRLGVDDSTRALGVLDVIEIDGERRVRGRIIALNLDVVDRGTADNVETSGGDAAVSADGGSFQESGHLAGIISLDRAGGEGLRGPTHTIESITTGLADWALVVGGAVLAVAVNADFTSPAVAGSAGATTITSSLVTDSIERVAASRFTRAWVEGSTSTRRFTQASSSVAGFASTTASDRAVIAVTTTSDTGVRAATDLTRRAITIRRAISRIGNAVTTDAGLGRAASRRTTNIGTRARTRAGSSWDRGETTVKGVAPQINIDGKASGLNTDTLLAVGSTRTRARTSWIGLAAFNSNSGAAGGI